jgi:NAD(P)-dependent dehydrogenase (short-subunit alcohol dehydrogenase family)
MQLLDRVIVVTGGASGIGRGMAERFAAEGARAVVVADMDGEGASAVAAGIGAAATGVAVDVSDEDAVASLVEDTERIHGPIDLFASNAGIAVFGGEEVGDDGWERIWHVNVMAHIYAARHVLPSMLARGDGYLLNTASAAGLLTQIGSAPYAVTKHAAVAFAEWLSVTYGDQGIKVSVLCPQAVRTNMTANIPGGGVAGIDGMIEPADVAQTVVEGLRDERFLILPHPSVLEYYQRKASDYDRWLTGMRRLQARFPRGGVQDPE